MSRSTVASAAGVRAARAILGWSQKELSACSGVSVPAINRFERGAVETAESTVSKLEDCLRIYGVDLTHFLEGGLNICVDGAVIEEIERKAACDEAVTPRGKFGPRKSKQPRGGIDSPAVPIPKAQP